MMSSNENAGTAQNKIIPRDKIEPVRDFVFSYLLAVDWRIGLSIRRDFRRMLMFSCFL